MAIDNYFCIDGAMVIHKKNIVIDDTLLDNLLRDKENKSLRWDATFKHVVEIEKPANWESVIPTQPYSDDIPMQPTDIYVDICRTKYQILKYETNEKLILQAINADWYKNYCPTTDIFYSPSKQQFTQWINNKSELVALIMPARFHNSYLSTMMNEINYFRSEEVKNRSKQ